MIRRANAEKGGTLGNFRSKKIKVRDSIEDGGVGFAFVNVIANARKIA